MYLLALLADKVPAKPPGRYKPQATTVNLQPYCTSGTCPCTRVFELYRFLKHLYSLCLFFLDILSMSCSLCHVFSCGEVGNLETAKTTHFARASRLNVVYTFLNTSCCLCLVNFVLLFLYNSLT